MKFWKMKSWKMAIVVPAVLIYWTGLIYGAVCLIDWMLAMVPANEWAGLVKIAIVLFSVFFGLRLLVVLMCLSAAFIALIVGSD